MFERFVLRALVIILTNLITKGGEYNNDACRQLKEDIESYLKKC